MAKFFLAGTRAWRFFAAALLVTSIMGTVAAASVINKTYRDGIAIEGYDPVAYFTLGEAVEGSDDYVYEFVNAKWFFVSAEHRDMFASDPLKYVPQYGGYCASVGGGTKADPRSWRIIDGKLYLFSVFRGVENFTPEAPFVKRADAKWEEVKRGLAP